MEDDTHSATENQDWDWEVLADNHHDQHHRNPNLGSSEEELDGDSSFIRSDYFSIESDYHRRHVQTPNPEVEMEKGIDLGTDTDAQFGSGSWMDPSQFARTRVGKRRRNSNSSSSSECSDATADDSGSGSGSGSDPRNHLLVLQPHSDCTQHCKEGDGDVHGNGVACEIESPSSSLSGQFDPQFHKEEKEEEKKVEAPHGDMNMVINEEEEDKEKENKSSPGDGNEKSSVAWWRVPLEVLKYCVLRVSPVWSLSVAAAALMGFVILRRRWLAKMKRKTQGIHLNVTVDDKKVSQFMSRAARLNEAFSVVKRVPIIRPSLPAPGFASWPVMSLR